MSTPTPNTKALYRTLLRQIPLTTSAPLRARLRSHFTSPPSGDQAQAAQFLTYIRAQRTYAALLERYNPSLGGWGGEGKDKEEERVGLTARRVGLVLPGMEEKGGKGGKE